MYSINHSLTHSLTHPTYLMPQEPKLALRNDQFTANISVHKSTHKNYWHQMLKVPVSNNPHKICTPKWNNKTVMYLVLYDFQVNVSFLCPLLPELWIVNVDVITIRWQAETGLCERRPFDSGLNLNDLSSTLKNVINVFLTEVLAVCVVFHQCTVCTFLQQVLDLLLCQLVWL